jgi:membrane peptidoglycan carboxypeptidase
MLQPTEFDTLQNQDSQRRQAFLRGLRGRPREWPPGGVAWTGWATRLADSKGPWAIPTGGVAWLAALIRPTQLKNGSPLARLQTLLSVALRWARSALPVQRVLLGGGLALVTASALAATQIWLGYTEHPAKYWEHRLQERLGSPIFSRDGQLQGSLFPAQRNSGGLNFADYGYLRSRGDLPPLWTQFVTTLEQQTLFDPWRSVCGLDPLGMLKRVVTGSGGGSGLAEQNARNLAAPEELRSPYRIQQALEKMRLWGAACSLHRARGGAQGMLRLYADYAPVAKVNGTLRGQEAGARILFNRAPVEQEPYQMALLASMAQRPLDLAPAAAFTKGCPALRAASRASLVRDEQNARNQCFNIARARVAVHRVMTGAARDEALTRLNELEATGIQPANPFQPLPTKRLVNLSARTQAALGTAVLQHVAEEADALVAPAGQPLTLTMAQPEQTAFVRDVRKALREIEDSPAGRETLCVPLVWGSRLRHCPGTPDAGAHADVVLARMSVEHGTLQRLFESTRLAFSARNALGSVGKMIIALAAAGAGYSAVSPVCPRMARDGARLLRRITRPEHGYASCRPAQHITLAEAMARSDNLAIYDVARSLGPQALRQAIEAVGLQPDGDPKANLAYQLAFGTQAGTPEELMALGQALFGVAFDVPVRSGGPRLLADTTGSAVAYQRVRRLLPKAEQRQALGRLLQAPVQHPAGTLHYLRGSLAAGKTGTTSALQVPSPGARAYLQAKYTLAYVTADRSVVLSLVGAPFGHALALHHLPGEALAPAMGALVKPSAR